MIVRMDAILPTLVSTIALVNSVIGSAKNARDLAIQSDNADVKDAVIGVYDAILEVKNRVLELDEENRKLREKLAQRESVKHDPVTSYCFKDGEPESPLCPTCYENNDKMIHLPKPYTDSSGIHRTCTVCSTRYLEEKASRPSSQPRYSGRDGWMG
jgi:hypothetical protein